MALAKVVQISTKICHFLRLHLQNTTLNLALGDCKPKEKKNPKKKTVSEALPLRDLLLVWQERWFVQPASAVTVCG